MPVHVSSALPPEKKTVTASCGGMADWWVALLVLYGLLPWIIAELLRAWVQSSLVWLVVSATFSAALLFSFSFLPVYRVRLWGDPNPKPASFMGKVISCGVATVGLIALGLGWSALVAQIQGHWPHPSQAHLISLSGWSGVLSVWGIGVVSPFVEELMFRGWGQSVFKAKAAQLGCPPWLQIGLGIVLPTVIFSALHSQYWNNLHALGATLVLGFWLGWMRHATGWILPGMVAHWSYNGLGLVLLVLGI